MPDMGNGDTDCSSCREGRSEVVGSFSQQTTTNSTRVTAMVFLGSPVVPFFPFSLWGFLDQKNRYPHPEGVTEELRFRVCYIQIVPTVLFSGPSGVGIIYQESLNPKPQASYSQTLKHLQLSP